MNNIKVVKIESECIEFENGVKLYSNHESDCCEQHWLSFEHLTFCDFEDLEFDLTGDSFFKKIEGYGIELMPINGHSVKVPGYGSNNGYYTTNLQLVLSKGEDVYKEFDITECQEISG
jgi:hypothetical protein